MQNAWIELLLSDSADGLETANFQSDAFALYKAFGRSAWRSLSALSRPSPSEMMLWCKFCPLAISPQVKFPFACGLSLIHI